MSKVSLGSKSSIKFYYLLRSKVKSRHLEDTGGGLALDKAPGGQVGRKTYISKAKLKAKKYIQDERRSKIYKALRAGLALQNVSQ
jgi:hypothetical protein